MEIEFRTGKREIPDHLAEMMTGMQTYLMTYEEAIELANKRLATNHVEKAINQRIDDHFRAMGIRQ